MSDQRQAYLMGSGSFEPPRWELLFHELDGQHLVVAYPTPYDNDDHYAGTPRQVLRRIFDRVGGVNRAA